MARPRKTDKPADEKIRETAFDLFFRQGYHRTGINQIIEEAGVSKATLYAHFPTKDDLAVAYLGDRIQKETVAMMAAIDAIEDPREAFLAYVRMLVPHMTETDFRGCGFSNVAVEITDARSPILSVIQDHDAMYLEHVEKTTRRLIASDPRRFRRMDAAATARTYYLLVEGALVASRNLRSLWPLEHAIQEVESWLR